MNIKLKQTLIALGSLLTAGAVAGSIVAVAIIYGRKNTHSKDSENIVYKKASNKQEIYANNNTLSLLFYIKPIESYLLNFIRNLNSNTANSNYGQLINYIENNQNSKELYSITTGTMWLFDYMINSQDKNIYYFASNIHVLNLGYTYKFPLTNGKIELFFPYLRNVNGKISTYVTQPIGNPNESDYQNYKNIINNDARSWNEYWLNLTSAYNSIIPLGAIYNGGNIENTNPYLGTIKVTKNNQSKSYFVDSNYNISESYKLNNSSIKANDMGLIRFDLNPTQFFDSQFSVRSVIKDNIYKIFDISVNVQNYLDTFTYIERVKYLTKLINDGYSSNIDEIKNKFLFNSIENVSNTQFTIGGYPGLSYSNSAESYVTFNCDTINRDLVRKNIFNIERNDIDVWYNSHNYYYAYDEYTNYTFYNVNLGSGSSGSMVINQNYQLVGIYWGVIETSNWVSGMVTPIYDLSNQYSLVFRWLNYLNNQNIHTEVFNLFELLDNNNYFQK